MTWDPKDLETIVTLMELAAIYLTSKPEDSFTEAQLLSQMHELASPEIKLDDVDIRIVLGTSRLFKHVDGRLALR